MACGPIFAGCGLLGGLPGSDLRFYALVQREGGFETRPYDGVSHAWESMLLTRNN